MLREGVKIDWDAKKWYEADYLWDEGHFKTTYAVVFKIYKGDYMFYKKRFNYVLEDGENLQEMLEKRTKSIATMFQL